jgi:hypothetical protein
MRQTLDLFVTLRTLTDSEMDDASAAQSCPDASAANGENQFMTRYFTHFQLT